MRTSSLNRRIGLWFLCVLPAILLWCQTTGLIVFNWIEEELTEIEIISNQSSTNNFLFRAPLKTAWEKPDSWLDSPANLIENGHQLKYPNATLDEIAVSGGGRFRLEGGWVWFSSSDGSDPRTSGRTYTMRLPTPIHIGIIWLVNIFAAIATLAALLMPIRSNGECRVPARWLVIVLRHPPIWLSLSFFLVPYIIARLPFLLSYRLPGITGDSSSYFYPATEILAGRWPDFSIRSPGYPLFLALTSDLVPGLFSMAVCQIIMSAVAAIVLITAAQRIHRPLAPWVALAMGIFQFSTQSLSIDTVMAPMSLYSAFLTVYCAFLMLALDKKSTIFFILCSIAAVLAIWTRPAGLFLIVIHIIVFIFMLRNRFKISYLISFMVPIIIGLGGLATYNKKIVDVFVISAWGEANLAGLTFPFWETDSAYPEAINHDIELIKTKFSKSEKEIINANDAEYGRTARVSMKGYEVWAEVGAQPLPSLGSYMAERQWIRRIALDSIYKNWSIYQRFFINQLINFYKNISITNVTYRRTLESRAVEYYSLKLYAPGTASAGAAMEYSVPPALPITVSFWGNSYDSKVTLESTFAQRLFDLISGYATTFFSSLGWIWAWLIVLGCSTWALLISGLRDPRAMIVTAVALVPLGAGITVSLVEISLLGYSHPTQFAYYISVALFPLVLNKKIAKFFGKS